MDNPFKKRATEFFQDAVGLLPLISPEPLRIFFDEGAEANFDRLVVVVGTPGSGKTTIARMMELDTLMALLKHVEFNKDLRALSSVLHETFVLQDGKPRFVACRLPAGSNFREIWELPYSEQVRHSLLRSFVQARSVLGWLRKIERAGVDLRTIRIFTNENAESQRRLIHADDVSKFREHARTVEEGIFKIVTSLLPPREDRLADLVVTTRYEAFDVLSGFAIPEVPGLSAGELILKPMLIIDDAHELHPDQFVDVERWLRDRELKIARWIVTRVDAIGPEDFRKAISTTDSDRSHVGTTSGRDRLIKMVQNDSNRVRFRGVAKDVCRRYFGQMPIFIRAGIDNLDRCLPIRVPVLAPSQLKQLADAVANSERDSRFSRTKLDRIKELVPGKLPLDLQLAVYRILLARAKKRTPQKDLFGVDPALEEGTDFKTTVKNGVVEGAEIQLMHQFDRPFYHGFDRLSDCSSLNIEQFISLAGSLVENIETKLIKGKPPVLEPREQDRILRVRATRTMEKWDFPRSDAARKLVAFIAQKCLERTLEENAPLDDGANAYGVLQSEMDKLKQLTPDLVPILHYSLAYNALSLQENYVCKNKTWCLIELGGLPLIAYRLPLSKGGFYEGRLSELGEVVA